MSRRGRSFRSVVLSLAALVLALPAAAAAHVQEQSGPFRVTMGWTDEPAYSGAPNAVEVDLAGKGGAPVAVPAGVLDVELSFGGSAALTSLPLVPSGAPGKLRATVVPTRPGTYAFHVSGTVRGHPIEARATCSGATFDCVTDASAVQFPAKDPSNGQLAERVARGLPRAERAAGRADSAHTVAVVALIVAGLALATGVATLVRARGQ
jgi:hypothetical protein